MTQNPETLPSDQRPALAPSTCWAPSSFLKEDDIRFAKEWAENLCIPWKTGDGWRSVACRLAHEVELLQKERDQAQAKLALAAETIIESNYYGGFAAPRGAAKVLHEILGLVLPNK